MDKEHLAKLFEGMQLESALLLGDRATALAVEFALMVAALEREACAVACERHAEEPQVMIATRIDDEPRAAHSRECAALIRLRDRG